MELSPARDDAPTPGRPGTTLILWPPTRRPHCRSPSWHPAFPHMANGRVDPPKAATIERRSGPSMTACGGSFQDHGRRAAAGPP